MPQIRRALLSVTDKTGIVDLARNLSELHIELLSTGGTARLIREAGVPVRDVADVTGFPEMLDGRVKTMHPKITGAILAIRDNPAHQQSLAEHGIEAIDMVVVNLYDFATAAAKPGIRMEDLVEQIDIGGPTMIRSAAKNYQDVAVVVSPSDYAVLIEELRANHGSLSGETTWRLARKAFSTTAEYDRAITARLSQGESEPGFPPFLDIHTPKLMDLRYGENPHQSAAVYGDGKGGTAGAGQLLGKELSYNNLVDLDAAWLLVGEFEKPAVAIIKHTNPCGCAAQQTLAESYRKALECDPISAFGGVVGLNRDVDEETAREMVRTFVEAIAAPAFSESALEVLKAKKNLRIVAIERAHQGMMLRSISGGYLAQTPDVEPFDVRTSQVKTFREPTDDEWRALEFGWRVAKHVKSNAIVYARPGQTVGIGAGQMSRVDSVRLGASKAVLRLEGSVIASDAFFPFADGIEEAARHGVTAVIQPGGSVKDNEVIEAANRLNLAMVFTGLRHFRH